MSMNFSWFRKSKKSAAQAARKEPPSPAGTPRRAHLELELLETRALLSHNVISGFVFHDLNNNGLYEPASGETPIANTHIELRNSAGVAVGEATTDANGFYQFSADQTIDASPKTITQTVTFP